MPDPSPVFVNGRFLTQPLSGMQRYAEEMVSGIDRLMARGAAPAGLSITVLVPPADHRRPGWSSVPIRTVGRLKGHVWEQFELGLYARSGILLNLTSAGPLMHARSVLAMHDANIFAHPEHFSRAYGTLHRFLRPRLARKAARLVTISEFSRRELARWCGVDPGRFTVIGDSAEHIRHVAPEPAILAANGLAPKRYVLCVGNQSANKNIALAVRAFARVRPAGYRLAVAGSAAKAIFGSEVDAAGEDVVRLGRVSDGELRSLYENAALFLFPSRYEGFGVPPLEAMTLGCPVLSSDSSAMPEVLGDAARYFPSDDLDACAMRLAECLADVEAGRWDSAPGLARAGLYDWDRNAAAMLALLAACRT